MRRRVAVWPGCPLKPCQGAVYSDLEFFEGVVPEADSDHVLRILRIQFPLSVVITQECDLQHDKQLLSVLVAPIHNWYHVIERTHLALVGGVEGPQIHGSTTYRDNIKDNEIMRYHYLEFPSEYELPEGLVDFKTVYSIGTSNLLRAHESGQFVLRLAPIFREQLTQRYAHYASRIGLPDEQP